VANWEARRNGQREIYTRLKKALKGGLLFCQFNRTSLQLRAHKLPE